jgi:exodeoxyribonuclease-3
MVPLPVHDMIIATWNVNSLNVRLPQVLDWLSNPQGGAAVDVLCLQETKLTDDKFPQQAFADAGWHCAFVGQKTYNGVALIARHPITDVILNNPLFPDEQKRLISGVVNGVRVISAYVVNGQALDSDKFVYKMAWLDGLRAHLAEMLTRPEPLVLAGDFNIAPTDADVHDPAAWEGMVLVSPQERAQFERLIALGLCDTFRQFEQAPRAFTWWDYRNLGFRMNKGLRIDHVLASTALAARCQRAWIDKAPRKNQQPSDHTPVLAQFEV